MSDAITVLVVDDSEDDRLLYRRALQKISETPYHIIETDSGEEVLQLIEKHDPHCVLLDYSLPGRNGVEVLKRIRSKQPHLPVVMLTGQGNEAVAVTVMQEGAQNYISKASITPQELQRVIRVAIEHCALHKRIEEQRRSLEIFTRALAHDLKEPVRTIRSFLDLISAHENLSEKAKGYFSYIQKAADRMDTLIDTVYFYTRLDGGDHEPVRETCDVNQVLEDAKENIRELIHERGATISSEKLPNVPVNRVQLIQVMQNLLCNAIRHCSKTPEIHVRAEEGEHQWVFRISDNGPGIASEQHERVFEPFKRLSRQEQGLGLGLAICKKIVESHGGSIWYETTLDEGATFLFTLPKIMPNQEHGSHHNATMHPNISNGDTLANILLVEDNEADVELTRILLMEEAHLHCNLLIARDSAEALQHLRSDAIIDLMLLDINMPGMTGFELLKSMRADASLPQVPVIICTTSSYDKDIEVAKSLGVIGYMNKPAELNKLKPVINKLNTLRLQQEGNGYTLLHVA